MLFDLENFIVYLLAGVLPLLVIAFCNWRVLRNVTGRTAADAQTRALKTSVYGVVAAIAAGLMLFIGLIGGVAFAANEGITDPRVLAWAAYGVVGIMVGLAVIPIFRLATQLRHLDDDRQHNLQTEIDRSAGTIEASAWGMLGVAIFSFSIVCLFLLPCFLLLLVFGLPTMIWQRRRHREGQLLWLLALAVQNNRDLAKEVHQHATTWTGNHACRLRDLAKNLRMGTSLADSLVLSRDLVPHWVLTSIRTASESGTLTSVLPECATQHLDWMKDRFRFGSPSTLIVYALGYLSITFAIVTFLMYYIVPKYISIWNGFGTELPKLTERMIEFSNFVSGAGLIAVPLLPIVFLTLLYMDHIGWRNIRLRIFGRLYTKWDSGNVLRHLSRTVAQGKPMGHGLVALANSYHRPSIAELLARVYTEVESGKDCWEGLRKARFINRREVAVIKAAERTGNLAWALRELATVREKRLLHRLDTVLVILRPLTVLAVGVLVAFISLAMLMPMVGLIGDLS